MYARFSLVMVGLITLLFFTACKSPPTTPLNKNALAFQLGEYQGFPVQLMLDKNSGTVGLLLIYGNKPIRARMESIDFMTSLVVHLVSANEPIQLGRTGYRFRFKQGDFPLWKAGNTIGFPVNFQFIWFAQRATLIGKDIHAEGGPTKADHTNYPSHLGN
jgi:hypothetical protein